MTKLFHINGKDEKAPIEAGDIVSDGVQVWRVVNDGWKLRLYLYDIVEELKRTPLNAKLVADYADYMTTANYAHELEKEFQEWDAATDADFLEWQNKTLQAG